MKVTVKIGVMIINVIGEGVLSSFIMKSKRRFISSNIIIKIKMMI